MVVFAVANIRFTSAKLYCVLKKYSRVVFPENL